MWCLPAFPSAAVSNPQGFRGLLKLGAAGENREAGVLAGRGRFQTAAHSPGWSTHDRPAAGCGSQQASGPLTCVSPGPATVPSERLDLTSSTSKSVTSACCGTRGEAAAARDLLCLWGQRQYEQDGPAPGAWWVGGPGRVLLAARQGLVFLFGCNPCFKSLSGALLGAGILNVLRASEEVSSPATCPPAAGEALNFPAQRYSSWPGLMDGLAACRTTAEVQVRPDAAAVLWSHGHHAGCGLMDITQGWPFPGLRSITMQQTQLTRHAALPGTCVSRRKVQHLLSCHFTGLAEAPAGRGHAGRLGGHSSLHSTTCGSPAGSSCSCARPGTQHAG